MISYKGIPLSIFVSLCQWHKCSQTACPVYVALYVYVPVQSVYVTSAACFVQGDFKTQVVDYYCTFIRQTRPALPTCVQGCPFRCLPEPVAVIHWGSVWCCLNKEYLLADDHVAC